MSELIKNYPLFSYIAVPVLFIALVVLTIIILRPRSAKWDYFSKLYSTTLQAIDFIDAESNAINREKLKTLLKIIIKIKSYYELLESEELYEVEEIVNNIEKAAGITRALYAARLTEGEISDYLTDIGAELKKVRKVLHGFSLTREDEAEDAIFYSFNVKKSRKKAEEYLSHIKKQ